MTPNETKVLDFVRERISIAGFAPSLTEVAERLGHKGKASAHQVVDRLVRGGYLERLPHRARGLRLIGVPDLRGVPTDAIRAELARRGATLDALKDAPRGRFVDGVVTCAADCCQETVRRGMLFCRRHWFLLPSSLQLDIKRAFAAKDEALYQVFVTEARDRIDRGARHLDPRQRI